jgi:hypothetical protein
MEVGWGLLAALPVTELTRLTHAQIERYLARRTAQEAASHA